MPTFPLSQDVRIEIEESDRQRCTTINGLADILTRECHFAKDRGGQLYFYKNGVYRPDGAGFVGEVVKHILNHFEIGKTWRSSKTREIVEYIKTSAPVLLEKPPLAKVNVQNGIIKIQSKTLEHHDSSFLTTTQLPVMYDPDSTCPQWEQFVADTFPNDAQSVAWELFAWLMLPYMEIQKSLLLVGSGCNGKSTFLKSLIGFLGPDNVCSVPLHRLEVDRFAPTRLIGKLANICPDLPSRKLESTAMFKSITGGDPIMAEYKFGDSFDIRPFCRLVFSANELPRSADTSEGFYRRFIILPFSKVFEENGKTARRLARALAAPGERSGVLNKALEVVGSVLKDGITIAPSMAEAITNYRRMTDPLAVWLDSETVEDPVARVPKEDLWKAYNQDCFAAGRPPVTREAFGRAFKAHRPDIQEAQRRRTSGSPVREAARIRYTYRGLTFVATKTDEELASMTWEIWRRQS